MKTKFLLFLFMLTCFFGIINQVSADESKTCLYSSTNNSKGYFQAAELNISNPKKSKAKVSFTDLNGPEIKCDGKEDLKVAAGSALSGLGTTLSTESFPFSKLIGGTISVAGAALAQDGLTSEDKCSFNANNVANSSSGTIDYTSKANGNIDKKLKYFDSNNKKNTVDLPTLDLGEGCPTYLMAVINDRNGSNNIQIFAGNEETKSFIESKIKESSYNYLIVGEEYNFKAEDAVSDEESSSEEEKDIDTCEGLLGNKVDGEYEPESVGALLQQIFDYMKYAAIIFIFVFSVIDYTKAITDQKQEAFKKANANLLKRIIFGIVFFILPLIVNLILSIIDSSACGIK